MAVGSEAMGSNAQSPHLRAEAPLQTLITVRGFKSPGSKTGK
jgi:hypothetical protein